MKISVITWDADFRDNLHTINFFAKQRFKEEDYELIWVDFYNSNAKVKSIIKKYKNFKLVTLDNHKDVKWHLGACINAGVEKSTGELLVIADGDIAIDNGFLSHINRHCNHKGLATYFRRYDEEKETSTLESLTSISYLDSHCKLLNPTNYAGCFALKRELFLMIGGYNTQKYFSGPGMNGMETYIRLRNFSAMIKWSEKKIFHPWHQNTGTSAEDLNKRQLLSLAKKDYPWISPYGGIEQSWHIFCLEKNLLLSSSFNAIDTMPCINLPHYAEILDQQKIIKEQKKTIKEQQMKIEHTDSELQRFKNITE